MLVATAFVLCLLIDMVELSLIKVLRVPFIVVRLSILGAMAWALIVLGNFILAWPWERLVTCCSTTTVVARLAKLLGLSRVEGFSSSSSSSPSTSLASFPAVFQSSIDLRVSF